jgi:hypothetical protein
VTRTAYHPVMSEKGQEHSSQCTSAIFAHGGKLGAVNFLYPEPPSGGVFGPEALQKVWYVTRTVCLTRILTRTAQEVSECARSQRSHGRRHHASRAATGDEGLPW